MNVNGRPEPVDWVALNRKPREVPAAEMLEGDWVTSHGRPSWVKWFWASMLFLGLGGWVVACGAITALTAALR